MLNNYDSTENKSLKQKDGKNVQQQTFVDKLYKCNRNAVCLCWGLDPGPLTCQSSTLPIELKELKPELVGMPYTRLYHIYML